MKIASVIKKDLKGEFITLYIGEDRSEARKIYKQHMTKKDEFQALFMTSGYESRTMSKAGFIAHNETKMTAPKPAPKKKSKKKEEK
jgi:hypothetical protein